MFTGNTDPYPYIMAAYSAGFVGIVGYSAWIIIQRSKIRKLLSVLTEDNKTP